MSFIWLRSTLFASFVVLAAGCANEAEPQTAADADDPCAKEEVKYAGRTAGSAAKTGGKTAAEGVRPLSAAERARLDTLVEKFGSDAKPRTPGDTSG